MSLSFYESLVPVSSRLAAGKASDAAAVSHLPLPSGFFLYGRPYFRCAGRLNETDGAMD
jgi:hypothetical protein